MMSRVIVCGPNLTVGNNAGCAFSWLCTDSAEAKTDPSPAAVAPFKRLRRSHAVLDFWLDMGSSPLTGAFWCFLKMNGTVALTVAHVRKVTRTKKRRP